MSKVVIIEDDPIVRKIYENKLRAEGNTVAVAVDGRSGIELVKSINPQLVLVDLMLPDISGVEVIKTLRRDANFANVPIIAYSGADDDVLFEAQLARSTRVLSKTTMSPREIYQHVKDLLEQNQNWQTPATLSGEKTTNGNNSADVVGKVTGRVLIVEDDLVNAAVVKSIVEKTGFETVVVNDGGEALRLLRGDANFAAGIFDVDLPKVSGTDLLRHMRTEKRLMKIPVIIMTANENLRVQLDAQNAGASLFISKPIERANFKMLFSLLVGKKNGV